LSTNLTVLVGDVQKELDVKGPVSWLISVVASKIIDWCSLIQGLKLMNCETV